MEELRIGVQLLFSLLYQGQFLRLFSFYPKVLKLWEPAAGSTDDISKRRPASAQLRVVIWWAEHTKIHVLTSNFVCKVYVPHAYEVHIL
ncbi:hypothetical protein TRIUR3_08715 [Triticum urartu]|uniref:Uncharacterized protein n=1 Tax=Triticum urartu TaxID=4572 RepID=M8AKN1_TRIUA|nr:hypothetical protein TRIUR3_08715 [Triticum urartu]